MKPKTFRRPRLILRVDEDPEYGFAYLACAAAVRTEATFELPEPWRNPRFMDQPAAFRRFLNAVSVTDGLVSVEVDEPHALIFRRARA